MAPGCPVITIGRSKRVPTAPLRRALGIYSEHIVDRTAARDVPLMVSPGQSSDTFLYTAATTAKAERDRHRSKTVVLTMYDYDLSGERCHEAVRRKLTGFYPGVPVEVHRLALTEQQVADWNLPTLPAKEALGSGREAPSSWTPHRPMCSSSSYMMRSLPVNMFHQTHAGTFTAWLVASFVARYWSCSTRSAAR